MLFAGEVLREGDAKSTVRVVVYEDLQCPECAVCRKMVDEQLLPKFGAQAALKYRNFPLPKHKWARGAVIAARFVAVGNPKTGVAFRRMTLANLTTINPENFNADLSDFAKNHDVEPARAIAALVEDHYQEGIARGISKTPTVFVDAGPFVEQFEREAVVKAIRAALEASKPQ